MYLWFNSKLVGVFNQWSRFDLQPITRSVTQKTDEGRNHTLYNQWYISESSIRGNQREDHNQFESKNSQNEAI